MNSLAAHINDLQYYAMHTYEGWAIPCIFPAWEETHANTLHIPLSSLLLFQWVQQYCKKCITRRINQRQSVGINLTFLFRHYMHFIVAQIIDMATYLRPTSCSCSFLKQLNISFFGNSLCPVWILHAA